MVKIMNTDQEVDQKKFGAHFEDINWNSKKDGVDVLNAGSKQKTEHRESNDKG